MTAMGLSNWFGHRPKDEAKTNEAVARAIEARATVSTAARRLIEAIDVTEGSRMELTLEKLIDARQVRRWPSE